MKKYSDYFSGLKRLLKKVGNRIAITALIMVAAITMGFTQDVTYIEGSVHSFKVDNHEGNTFVWGLQDQTFNPLDPLAFTFIEGQFGTDVTLRFNDMKRVTSELVYLVVTETRPEGCSTSRALQIQLEPNNMYLEFASDTTQDCFTIGEYLAPLKIGLNFADKAAGVPIPESFFPLKVTYTIENKTAGTIPIMGNGGDSLTIAYNPLNDYYMLVTEAVGLPDQTTEYELKITSVTAKYDTDITKNSGDIRIQIRVINHLPQSGNMDMALAYYVIK